MNEIEQAIEDHDRKKSKRFWIGVLIMVGICGLGFVLLYGCACMNMPQGCGY